MAPITYEQHCAACHTLDLTEKIAHLPHKRQPAEMVVILEERLRGNPQALNPVGPRVVNLPGNKGVAGRSLDERLDIGLRMMFESKRMCAECHLAEGGGELSLPQRKPGESLADYAARFPKVARPDVPETWFKHARFNHESHRDMNCLECHKEAGAGSDAALWADYNKPRKGAEAVMLPAIDNCRQCHSPHPEPRQVERNLAAKYDCTECHGYHNGKAPTRP
jgi:hypothetical protein